MSLAMDKLLLIDRVITTLSTRKTLPKTNVMSERCPLGRPCCGMEVPARLSAVGDDVAQSTHQSAEGRPGAAGRQR